MEWLKKNEEPYNWQDWTFVSNQNIPYQRNGYDCGMFACVYAEYLSRNENFDFEQKHMPYLRDRFKYELLTNKLLLD